MLACAQYTKVEAAILRDQIQEPPASGQQINLGQKINLGQRINFQKIALFMSESNPFASQRPRNKRLLQNHDTLAQWIQHILNLGVVSVTLCIFAFWRDGEVGQQYRTMLAFAILLMTITYHIMGVFRRFDRLEGAIQHLARAWGIVIIILAWTAFLTRTSEEYSRQVIVYWVLAAFFGQALLLTVTYNWFKLYRRFQSSPGFWIMSRGKK